MPDEFERSAKSFSPAAGKANVYVVRWEIVDASIQHGILVDNTFQGSLATDSFFLFEVQPGVHTVSVTDSRGDPADTVQLVVAEGKNYFFEIFTSSGFPPVTIAPLDDDRGRELVAGTRRGHTLYQ
jgi:hypothetical protein